jgi:DDE family transposase
VSRPHPHPPNSSQVLPEDRRLALHLVSRGGGFLQDHLARLAALPAHGNRTLHADQLLLGLLLAFFDPLARSLRTIEDHGDFGGRLDLPRLARSTTADALAAFDPATLKPVIDDLRDRVPGLADGAHDDADLASITRRIIAGDGTYLTTLADVAWALRHTKSDGRKQGQVRANVQLDVATWAPQVVTISGDDGLSEPAAFAPDLLSGVLYVFDRNFLDFSFITQVLAKGNDFVLRVRANAPAAAVLEARALTARDAEQGVIADELVRLTGRGAPGGVYRRVTIVTTNRRGEPETIILLTNLIGSLTGPEVAAHVIGAVYRLRWQIELFFKWLKTWARMDHLLSTSKSGITFQFYVAVIGVLMMYVQSGRRVSVYALAALGRLARGQCTVQEAMAVIARRERERELNRVRQARRRARKKLA